MVQDPRRKQRALERKKARRKERKKSARRTEACGWKAVLAEASRWPIHEVLVSEGWDSPERLATVLVARCSSGGRVAHGTFLVDLGCLGVKDTFPGLFESVIEYEATFRRQFLQRIPMIEADIDLAARIIESGIEFASRFGFAPHPGFSVTRPLLAGADPDRSRVQVPVGDAEGKPTYYVGPNDDVPAIVAQLTRAAGRDGFLLVGGMESLAGT